MYVVQLASTDPYRNLATEEYLLRQKTGDWFMLWRNAPCIVVGRNQNTHAEINRDYVEQNGIAVVRRLTGGGAVFHDLGNVNYTFIEEGASDQFGNYAVFSQPVLDVLHGLGIPAALSGRNDLLIDGRKFCGNAQTLWHGRMMHHGCILFSASLSHLSEALRVNPLKIQSKGIRSVRSRVTNISEHLTVPMTAEAFLTLVLDSVLSKPGNERYELTAADDAAIDRLVAEKYATYAWNYGFPKEYTFQKDTLFPGGGLVSVAISIQDDKIAAMRVTGDFFGIRDVAEFEANMVGAAYDPHAIANRLQTMNFNDYFAGIEAHAFVNAMF